MAKLVLLAALALLSVAAVAHGQAYSATGTLGVEPGGSCGFTVGPPAGFYLAAFSETIYKNGLTCGGCYMVTCVDSKQCIPGRKVNVQVGNICQGKNTSSPCVVPKAGVSLQPTAFDVIVSSRAPGIVGMRYKQIPCTGVKGGVQLYVTSGNQYYFAVLIQNVAGPGSISAVSILAGKPSAANKPVPMVRSYGSVWEVRNYKGIVGQPLSLYLTGTDGQTLVVDDAIPATWAPKKAFVSKKNFGLVPKVLATKKVAPAKKIVAATKQVAKYRGPIGPVFSGAATLGSTAGGACGFLAAPAVTKYVAGFAPKLYQQGAICGGCFKVSCVNSKQCIPGRSVIVQATNLCTAKNTSAVCLEGQNGLNLQPEAFDVIVNSRSPGTVPVAFQRVTCDGTKGGIQFKIVSGNNYYFAVVVQNVGGPASVASVNIKTTSAAAYKPMVRSYGAVWAVSNTIVKGQALSFIVTTFNGQRMEFKNVIPANWAVKGTYVTTLNF